MVNELSPSPSLPARSRPWFLWILGFNLLLVVVAILSGMFHPNPDKVTPTRYFGEGKYPTVISIIQLATVGGLCVAIWMRRRDQTEWGEFPEAAGRSAVGAGRSRLARHVWLLFAAGFVFLALDEWLEIHEKLDSLVHKHVLGFKATGLTDRIDDLIVLGYGVAGLGVMWLCRRELWAFRSAWPYVVFTVAAAVASVAMDVLTNRDDLISGPLHTWLTVGEDSLKLVAEAGFLGAAIHALLLARSIDRPAEAGRDRAIVEPST